MLKKTSKLIKASVALTYSIPTESSLRKRKGSQTSMNFPEARVQAWEPFNNSELGIEGERVIETCDLNVEDFIPSLSQAEVFYYFQTRNL
ncbi:MAG: hypothetical protein V4615_01795 [Bacteroidota bacterium]